jgi:HEAT repeat protein
MKKQLFSAFTVLLACVPVAILVLVAVRREPMYRGRPATAWLNAVKIQQQSSGLEALKAMGQRGVPSLRRALKSPEIPQRLKAAWTLGQLGPAAQEAVPDLMAALDDEAAAVRVFSVQSLTTIGGSGDDLVSKLVAKLSDPNLGVSNGAADLLNKIEQERKAKHAPVWTNELGYAMAFLNASSERARLMGVGKLANCSREDGRVVQALKSLSNDTNEWVRQRAAYYLENNVVRVAKAP